jgi:phosphatidylglycerophosphate synthase
VRKTERPTYGYYLDHLVDALATALIGIGLGLSPYMLLSIALAIVIVYLVMSINVYLEAAALRVFRLDYGRIGPTEARVILIAINSLLALGIGTFRIDELGLSAFDVLGLGLVVAMGVVLVGRAAANLRALALEEPSARRAPRAPAPGAHS